MKNDLFFVVLLFLVCEQCSCQSHRLLQNTQGGIKFNVNLNADKSVSNSGEDDELINYQAMLTLSGQQVERRVPISLTLIVDSSASTANDNQLQLIKDSSQFIAENMAHRDWFGIGTFNIQAYELQDLQMITNSTEVESIIEKINQLSSGGASNLIGGVELGIQQQFTLHSNRISKEQLPIIQAVIVYNGGLANVGVTSVEEFSLAIEKIVQDTGGNTRVFTLGFKKDAQPEALEAIASASNGAFFYLLFPEDIQKAFGLAFADLITTYYRDVLLDIKPASAQVNITGIQSSGEQQSDSQDFSQSVKFSNLGGESRSDTVISFTAPKNLTNIPLLNIAAQYEDLIASQSISDEVDVVNDAEDGLPLSTGPQVAALRFQVANNLVTTASLNDTEQVKQSLQQGREELKQGGVMSTVLQQAFVEEYLEADGRRLLQSQISDVEYDRILFDAMDMFYMEVLRLLEYTSQVDMNQIRPILKIASGTLKTQQSLLPFADENAFPALNRMAGLFANPLQKQIFSNQLDNVFDNLRPVSDDEFEVPQEPSPSSQTSPAPPSDVFSPTPPSESLSDYGNPPAPPQSTPPQQPIPPPNNDVSIGSNTPPINPSDQADTSITFPSPDNDVSTGSNTPPVNPLDLRDDSISIPSPTPTPVPNPIPPVTFGGNPNFGFTFGSNVGTFSFSGSTASPTPITFPVLNTPFVQDLTNGDTTNRASDPPPAGLGTMSLNNQRGPQDNGNQQEGKEEEKEREEDEKEKEEDESEIRQVTPQNSQGISAVEQSVSQQQTSRNLVNGQGVNENQKRESAFVPADENRNQESAFVPADEKDA